MAKNKDIDYKLMKQIKDHAVQLKKDYFQRDADFAEYDDAYLLRKVNDPFNAGLSNVKIVASPDARNTVLGVTRLMVASDPQFSIDYNKANKQEKAAGEKIERAITRMWDQAGRIAGNPIHYDAILSAILYAEQHIAITSTADLLKIAKQSERPEDTEEGKKKSRGNILRAERTAALTPYLFECWNPRGGYPEFDRVGTLTGYYRVSKTTPAQLARDFGDSLPTNIKTGNRYIPVELHEFYDLDYKAVWVTGGDVLLEAHGMPMIPISVQITEGSRLFDKPEEQRQPLLFTLIKSNLWSAQNIAMTVLYTLVYGMGITPMYTHTAPPNNPGKRLDLNFSIGGGAIELEPGEQFNVVTNKGIIDPSLAAAMELAERKGQESTIYRQALGEALGRNTTFSETNLVAQSGRLPLTPTQKRGAWGIGGAVETALQMFRLDAGEYKGTGIELGPADISPTLQVDVKLDVKLPQDQLQLANIANIVANGDDPLVSHRWARENVLNISNPEQMQRDIWQERAGSTKFAIMLEEIIKSAQQRAQAAVAGMGGGGVPGGTPQPGQTPMQQPPQQMPEQMPEQMPPMPMPGEPNMPAAPGEMQGGLPPAQGGMIPGGGYA